MDATADVCFSNHLLTAGADRRRQKATIVAAWRSPQVRGEYRATNTERDRDEFRGVPRNSVGPARTYFAPDIVVPNVFLPVNSVTPPHGPMR